VFKRALFFILLVAFITTVIVLWHGSHANTFFRDARGLFIGAIVLGSVMGVIGAAIKRGRKPERHTVDAMMEHWGTAVGIFILMISGFQVRFYPGFAATNLHFIGLFLTLLFGFYFLADFAASNKFNELLPDDKDIIDGTIKKYLLHMKSKEIGKYLSSQKSSFLAFIVIGGLIAISGTIKLLVFYIRIPSTLLQTSTTVHDISAVLFVLLLIVHVFLVLAIRSNRVLLPSWFTGRGPLKLGHDDESPEVEPPVVIEEPAATIAPAPAKIVASPVVVTPAPVPPVQAKKAPENIPLPDNKAKQAATKQEEKAPPVVVNPENIIKTAPAVKEEKPLPPPAPPKEDKPAPQKPPPPAV
jgi:cytochrome b subunit of formate dehydrogenase